MGKPAKYKLGHNNRGKSYIDIFKEEPKKGKDNRLWKRGWYRHDKGYKMVHKPYHPYSNKYGYIMNHRVVLEQYYSIKFGIPIYIMPYFDVDHINGIKNDDRPQNLQFLTKREHKRKHMLGNKMHPPLKDFSKRFCKICGAKTTYIDKDGQPRWHGNDKKGYTCNTCACREYKIRKKYRA